MTDREKLIELLGYETCKDKECIGCKHYSDETGCIDYLKAELADHLIANGVVLDKDESKISSKWIPVSERLPEVFGEFAVAVKTVNGEMCADYADYDPFLQRWRTSCFIGDDECVTHWMPLPEPPKGE